MSAEPARLRDNRVLQGTAIASAFLILLGLGTWQMERLRWKESLLADITARAGATPVPAPDTASDLPEYTPVFADGVFRHDLELLLVPRTRAGVAGAHVLTPLVRPGAPAVLVNRGFVPVGFEPTVTRRAGNPSGPVRVEGLLRLQHPPGPFVPDNDPAGGSWYSIDLAAMGEATGLELAGYVLDAGPSRNPGGWPEGGQTNVSIRNTHLEYALTWYGLAGVLAACVSVLGRRAGGSRQRRAGNVT
ncbi:MAG: SURF1 family protein [Rhodospirillales bacterium]|nr:SURF1 family protein [Rhodospirillales bacterium]